ncbi:MAG: hypothetical protein K6B75_05820 [Lachnospiraceae bacterium]|nr:hypothetical protein [Lachnospiraceae bacterium]
MDNYDRNVELTVGGNLDINVAGTYKLPITIADDAGNSYTRTMTVDVLNAKPTAGPTTPPKYELFDDFKAKYKNDNTAVGIDVSRWQETIDFEKVKAAGCEFVMMRIGGYDNGSYYTDKYFKDNIAGAKAAGLKVGIYWHAEEGSAEEVRESVNYLVKVLNGAELDFPIAYDWEDFINFENYGMNLMDINNNFDVFSEELKSRGYVACLYGSKYYIDTIWIAEREEPDWVAQYASKTTYTGEYFMWQHSSSGRIDGIKGNVDLDVLYKNIEYSKQAGPVG